MKLNAIGKFSIDSILRSPKGFLISLVLSVVTFVLIGISSYAYDVTQHGEKSVDEILEVGLERTGILTIESDILDSKVLQFYNKAYELEEILSIGDYSNDTALGDDELSELNNIQYQHGQNYPEEGLTKVFLISASLLDLIELPLAKGEAIESVPEDKGNCWFSSVYLGSDFSDIPIGTIYQVKDEAGEVILEYCVKGILEKGARWLEGQALYNTQALNAVTTTPLDNMVVCVTNHIGGSQWVYTISDNTTFEMAEQKLKELAKEYGISITMGTAKEVFKEIERENSKITTYTLQLFGVIVITAFVVMMCIQLAGMLNQLSEYGTLYASGASTRDLVFILLMENIIKVAIALFVSGAICYYILNSSGGPIIPDYMRESYLNILYQSTYIKMAFVGTVFCLCLSSIPMIILRRIKPVALLGGSVE